MQSPCPFVHPSPPKVFTRIERCHWFPKCFTHKSSRCCRVVKSRRSRALFAIELRLDRLAAPQDVILVKPTTVPSILLTNLQLINSTRLGSILCIEPRFALEPRIIQAFRTCIQTCRTALVLGVDIHRATVFVSARPVCDLERQSPKTEAGCSLFSTRGAVCACSHHDVLPLIRHSLPQSRPLD